MRNSFESGDKSVYDPQVVPTELVIARFDVILTSLISISLPSEFTYLFKKKVLTYGVNRVRFPIINISRQRSLNRFLKKYSQCVLRNKTPVYEEME